MTAEPRAPLHVAGGTGRGPGRVPVELVVNGARHRIDVEPRRTLADVLRHDLGLTGTHVGCEHGVCGACTVLLAGEPTRSCIVFAAQADGVAVTTVEDLARDGRLNRLQEAFSRHGALQCGFCTPGFLMLATAFLDEVVEAVEVSERDVRELLASNLCRCTGYQGLVDAVLELAAARDVAGATGGLRDVATLGGSGEVAGEEP